MAILERSLLHSEIVLISDKSGGLRNQTIDGLAPCAHLEVGCDFHD
jgi:hypothetical protein